MLTIIILLYTVIGWEPYECAVIFSAFMNYTGPVFVRFWHTRLRPVKVKRKNELTLQNCHEKLKNSHRNVDNHLNCGYTMQWLKLQTGLAIMQYVTKLRPKLYSTLYTVPASDHPAYIIILSSVYFRLTLNNCWLNQDNYDKFES